MDARVDPGTTPEEFFDFASCTDDGLFSRYADILLQMQVSSRSFSRSTIIDELVAGGIAPIPAADLVDAFRERFHKGNIGVFWDYENLQPDRKQMSFTEAMTAMRRRLSAYGAIQCVNLYCPDRMLKDVPHLAGAVHQSVPHLDRTEVADKMIIVDAITFAFTTDDPIVVVVSCDSDFSALLSKMNMMGVRTISVSADGKHVRSMRSVAMINLSWPSDFISRGSGGGGGANQPSSFTLPPPILPLPVPASQQHGHNHLDDDGDGDGDNTKKMQRTPTDNERTNVLPTPTSSCLTAPFPRSHSHTSSITPILRANSMSFDVPDPGFSLTDGDDDDLYNDSTSDTQTLVKILARLQAETGNRRIRRSKVGSVVKNIMGALSFSTLVSRAVAEGLVDVGGAGGMAWIGRKHSSSSSSTAAATGGGESGSSGSGSNRPSPNKRSTSPSSANQQQQQQVQHAAEAWPPNKPQPPPTTPNANSSSNNNNFYLSYRLLKDRSNSRTILSIKPDQVAPFEIVDTSDALEGSRYTRRAFGPFETEELAMRFGASLANASWMVPRVLKQRPK